MNKLREGVELLAKTRQDWINKRTPSALIRAARHYEAAAQVCVRKTVMPVQKVTVSANIQDEIRMEERQF